nr:hemagglutinin repeat-containing protein [Methylotenera sp.]
MQNNINLMAAPDVMDETHYKKVKTSGFSTSGASISYGTSQLKNTSDIHETTNVASTVGSINGDVNINAGNHYQQTGSDVLAPAGDINITAKDVDITAATDTYNRVDKMSYKKTGITPVISAIKTASQMSQAASKTSDPRMQALAAATTALSVKNAADAVIAGNTPKLDENGLQVLDDNGHNTAENPANQVGGINVSISIGSSKSSSTQTQTNTIASSSHVTARGDINIKATGADTSTGVTSDIPVLGITAPLSTKVQSGGAINIIGSQVKANGDVTLNADHNINLLAAENVDTLNGKNNSSSASIGVSYGTSGLLFTASASGSKGKTKGNGTTWTETTVQSGNHTGDTVPVLGITAPLSAKAPSGGAITLNSGNDTNLIGAQVAGNQVIANVGTNPLTGGNLNIQSLQDTNQYKDKQQSLGSSISVGYGKMGGSVNY